MNVKLSQVVQKNRSCHSKQQQIGYLMICGNIQSLVVLIEKLAFTANICKGLSLNKKETVFCKEEFVHLREHQKQPTKGVLKKRCPENMQQIYRKTPMPKCDGCSTVNLRIFSEHPFVVTPLGGCFWNICENKKEITKF